MRQVFRWILPLLIFLAYGLAGDIEYRSKVSGRKPLIVTSAAGAPSCVVGR